MLVCKQVKEHSWVNLITSVATILFRRGKFTISLHADGGLCNLEGEPLFVTFITDDGRLNTTEALH